MKVHVMTGGTPLRDFATMACDAADAGYAGLVITESGRTAYLSAAAAVLADADLDLATGVAVRRGRAPAANGTYRRDPETFARYGALAASLRDR